MSDLIPKVALRGGFSDRNNFAPINTEMQYTDFDKRTRIAIVNLSSALFEHRQKSFSIDRGFIFNFIRHFLWDVYTEQIDFHSQYDTRTFFEQYYNRTVLESTYSDVLTVVEYFCDHICGEFGMSEDGDDCEYQYPNAIKPSEEFNKLFEKEYVGYRFIGELITPITNENEITAIREASSTKYEVVSNHIHKSIEHLSNRTHPDYQNSIKESITAVETMCDIIVQKKNASLGEALKHLEDNGVLIHSALKTAFNSLYGYTSDANGIRHSGNIDGPTATFAEAKYMLVSCSGFVNYLIELYSNTDKIER